MAGLTGFGTDVQSIGAFIDAIMDRERLTNGRMDIVSIGLTSESNPRMACIAYSAETHEYAVGVSVKIDDADKGTVYWGQGYYGYPSRAEAMDELKCNYGYRTIWE